MKTLAMIQGVNAANSMDELISHIDQIQKTGCEYNEFFSIVLDEAITKKADELHPKSRSAWAWLWGLI
jgi:hypothetical protein